MDDMSYEIKEFWFEFYNPEKTEIRIQINYLYQKLMMYNSQTNEWKLQLNDDVQDYNNIQEYLEMLQKPYTFLNF
jgi:hypothetical protein